MIYDPLQVGLDLLRSEIANVPVTADLVGHKTGNPRLVVSLVGITVAFKHRLDRVSFDIDAYGPNRNAALMLAMRARHVLLQVGPKSSFNGVAISDAEENLGPQDLADGVSREYRFVFSVSLYMFLRS
ncbi:hypothetical protein [Nonomuraea roseola]|uniref:Uncharacterized protein n=1 Tax=Nonomuraea roseola TaxID=46179 RepID=A0ABV5Q0M0_9ACTN